jgi:hypothetical protein
MRKYQETKWDGMRIRVDIFSVFAIIRKRVQAKAARRGTPPRV